MERIYSVPDWFFGYNIVLEFLFFLLAGLVALYAFRTYRMTYARETRLFGMAFSFLSVSYFLIGLSNLLFLKASGGMREYWYLESFVQIRSLIFILYVFLFVGGFATLLYTTQRAKNTESFLLIIILSIFGILLSKDKSFSIYFLSSLFLIVVSYNYLRLYVEKGNRNTLYVMIGMLFFFASSLTLLFSQDYFSHNLYAVSHVFDVFGYLFIFFSLIRVLKNGKEKKQA